MKTQIDEKLFRPGQLETIKLIDEVFENGSKFIILDAPTGAGKSLINLMSAQGRDTYITTPQRLLVDQYIESIQRGGIYAGLGVSIKGRATYKCKHLIQKNPDKNTFFSADGAPCQVKKQTEFKCPFQENGCDYYDAVRKAQMAPVTITTLAYMLMAIRTSIERNGGISRLEAMNEIGEDELKGWFRRSMLIVDEAHNFDDAITNFFTVEISPYSMDGQFNWEVLYEQVKDLVDDDEIIRIVKAHTMSQIDAIRPIIEKENDDEMKSKLNTRLLRMMHLMYKLDFETSFIVQVSPLSVQIKPFSPAPFIKAFMHSFDRVLLSSATFVEPGILMKNLGVGDDEYSVIQMPSGFDPKKAPVIFDDVGALSMKTMNDLLPAIKTKVEYYMNYYPKQRVLIHCHTYVIANYLKQNINSTRLISHTSKNREQMLDHFLSSTDGVLLSVNMTEGLDLKDDLCRVQIIVKCPYLNLGDRWIKTHMLADGHRWYEGKTLSTVIQACGRIVRNADDAGVTIILDSSIRGLFKRLWGGLPEHFKRRVYF